MKNKDTTIRETIRLNIISNRKRMKMRQIDLAQYLGIKKNTVASWEQGLSTPDIDTICALLKLFEMDFYEVCYITRNIKNEPPGITRKRLYIREDK